MSMSQDELDALEKRLLHYCADLDATERPSLDEYDVTADIRTALTESKKLRATITVAKEELERVAGEPEFVAECLRRVDAAYEQNAKD